MGDNPNLQVQSQGFERVMYFDYLRILATAAVMVIHICASTILEPSVFSFDFNVLNFYDSIARWAVPVFAMISGAIFLDNEIQIPFKSIMKQNVLRILTAFCFWSVFYVVDYCITYEVPETMDLIEDLLGGHYHMWFLFMIVGLYIIVPIVRKITADIKLAGYFVLLAFIFTFFLPEVLRNPPLDVVYPVFHFIQFNITRGYVCYFVAGYWLHKIEIKKSIRYLVYLLGIAGFAATVILTMMISRANNEFYPNYQDYFTMNVMFEAVALFVFSKYELSRIRIGEKTKNVIIKLSTWSFGAYLIHAFFIEKLALLGFTSLSYNPVIAVPALTVAVFIASTLVSAIISKIPGLKKYIV